MTANHLEHGIATFPGFTRAGAAVKREAEEWSKRGQRVSSYRHYVH